MKICRLCGEKIYPGSSCLILDNVFFHERCVYALKKEDILIDVYRGSISENNAVCDICGEEICERHYVLGKDHFHDECFCDKSKREIFSEFGGYFCYPGLEDLCTG